MINPFEFEQLIAPISEKEFFEEYWEKKPLVISNRDKEGYGGLINLKEVEYLISTLYSGSSWIRFFDNKKESRGSYLRDVGDYSNAANKGKIKAGFNQGNTIILSSLQMRWEPIRKFCSGLEMIFGHPFNTQLFLSPPNSQGFQTHFDVHDVFILQIEGEKLWKIYDNQMPFAYGKEDTPFFGKLDPPQYELHLKPGDFIYLPRGFVHEVSCTTTYSLHLTVGIPVFTWIEFLTQIALNVPDLRRGLPRRMLMADQMENPTLPFQDLLLSACNDPEIIRKAFLHLKQQFTQQKTKTFEMGLIEPLKITENSSLKIKEGIQCSLATKDQEVAIIFGEMSITGPLKIEPVLEYIINERRFSIADLPDNLSTEGKMTLVRSLLKAGLLELLA